MNTRLQRVAALMLICLLSLSGCASGAQVAGDEMQRALPDPPTIEDAQILGDVRDPYTRDVTLYYAVENSLDLTGITRAVEVNPNETLISQTLLELLKTLSGTGALRTVSSSEQLIDLEYSCGTVCVNLTLEAGARQSDQDGLLLCAAIADTLLGLEGVEAVNILAGGRSEAVCALPLGAINEPSDNISALYAQLQSEESRFLTEQTASISRNVILYFPSSDGGYLLPELRELTFDSDDYASVILDALKAGPMERDCCFSAMPGNQELLSDAPRLWISDAGERVIDVNFSQMLPNYLAFAGVDAWQLYGSVALSLCSFLPELDAVRICVDGAPVETCALGEAQLQFEGGLMRRSDFSARIGSSAMLYFADSDGGLRRVECAMSRSAAVSPKRILAEMILAEDPGSGLTSVFPDGILPEDILGVEISGNIAVVNLSGSFYSRCQLLDASGERRLIYAMINSLTELVDVGAVRFIVEGRSIDTMVQSIYLRTPLLPDPGIVHDGDNTLSEN
ncbi:MAG: GerMN domain-containing protein [Clostridia bacterium]|nr:GerMN domain-containing protein [Clostridia bacterium]